MNKKPSTKKLVVKKQTLRTLASDELANVQGGAIIKQGFNNNCTANLSGCISMC